MKSSTYYFHAKTKILEDFQICISVILMLFVVNLGIFCIQQELSRSKSNSIPFKR